MAKKETKTKLVAPGWDKLNQEFLEAADVGDADLLEKALERGADPESYSSGKHGKTRALFKALSSRGGDRLRCVNLLLSAGADPNEPRDWRSMFVRRQETPLSSAIMGDGKWGAFGAPEASLAVVEALLAAGADPLAKIDGELALWRAIRVWRSAGGDVAARLAADPSLEGRQDLLDASLWAAAGHGMAECVEILLRKGANPKAGFGELGALELAVGSRIASRPGKMLTFPVEQPGGLPWQWSDGGAGALAVMEVLGPVAGKKNRKAALVIVAKHGDMRGAACARWLMEQGGVAPSVAVATAKREGNVDFLRWAESFQEAREIEGAASAAQAARASAQRL